MKQNKRNFIEENRQYWTQRSPGYSQVNQAELHTISHDLWKNYLSETIQKQFSSRKCKKIKALDIGTGPGFLAIILAEAGFEVTGMDLTESMLEEAEKNAGYLKERISFIQGNAERTDFADESFDILVCRNLTWNLPDPDLAYKEWHRILKKEGMLLVFDANWYRYLFDRQAKQAYEEDRQNTKEHGIKDENIGENFDVMEEIALHMPLSKVIRPSWDIQVLAALGMEVHADTEVWQKLWNEEEKINFASTPMFMVKAIKR